MLLLVGGTAFAGSTLYDDYKQSLAKSQSLAMAEPGPTKEADQEGNPVSAPNEPPRTADSVLSSDMRVDNPMSTEDSVQSANNWDMPEPGQSDLPEDGFKPSDQFAGSGGVPLPEPPAMPSISEEPLIPAANSPTIVVEEPVTPTIEKVERSSPIISEVPMPLPPAVIEQSENLPTPIPEPVNTPLGDQSNDRLIPAPDDTEIPTPFPTPTEPGPIVVAAVPGIPETPEVPLPAPGMDNAIAPAGFELPEIPPPGSDNKLPTPIQPKEPDLTLPPVTEGGSVPPVIPASEPVKLPEPTTPELGELPKPSNTDPVGIPPVTPEIGGSDPVTPLIPEPPKGEPLQELPKPAGNGLGDFKELPEVGGKQEAPKLPDVTNEPPPEATPSLPSIGDNEPLGERATPPSPTEPMPPTTPIEQATPGLDRPTLPKSKPAPEPATPADKRTDYDVDLHDPEPGETYTSISRQYYGDAKYAEALRAYNRGRPVAPNGTIYIPPTYILRGQFSQLISAQVGGEAKPTAGPAVSRAADLNRIDWAPSSGTGIPRSYTLPRDGMTLWDVAQEVYGDRRDWQKLWDSNPRLDPNQRLEQGSVVRIP